MAFGKSRFQKAGAKILMAFRRNKKKIRKIGRGTFAGMARSTRSMASKFIGGNRSRLSKKFSKYSKSQPMFNIAKRLARNLVSSM